MKKLEYQSGFLVVKIVRDEEDSYKDRWHLFINEHGKEKVHLTVGRELTSVELKRILDQWLKGEKIDINRKKVIK